MGMSCEVNSILKLTPDQGYPPTLDKGSFFRAKKSNYRIIPVDVPIPLVNENWEAYADIIIRRLIWEAGETFTLFEVDRVYDTVFVVKP